MRKKLSNTFKKNASRKRRKISSRKKIFGTLERPRLVVFRSLNNIYAQLVDDSSGRTLSACSSLDKGLTLEGKKTENSFKVGQLLGEKALKVKIKCASVDRNGFKYHGRVKALIEGARKAGLRI